MAEQVEIFRLQRKGVGGELPWICVLWSCDFLGLAVLLFQKRLKLPW